MQRTTTRGTIRRTAGALAATVGLAVLSACSTDPAAGREVAAAESPAQQPGPTGDAAAEDIVTVTGVGTAQVEPDAARVSVGVEVVESELIEAFEGASEQADAVIAALRDAGVDDDRIRTSSIDVRAQRDEPREPGTGTPDITGYVVRYALEVRIADVDEAGEILAAAVTAGGDATRIDGFQLVADDDTEALADAREAAFERAESTAQGYAELAGRSLGPVQMLTENPSGPAPVESFEVAADAAAPPIATGTLTVTVTIRATWALQ